METTFISLRSSKTLTLASFSPAILPAASLRSIGREYLGCCHCLRPPGGFHLRTRARIRKSCRNPIRSPPFFVRASLDSGLLLVVVAVSAFSAAAFSYCHQRYGKQKNSSELSASPAATLHGENVITEKRLESEFVDGGDIHEGNSVEISGILESRTEENTDNVEEEETDQIREPALMQDDSVTKTSVPRIDDSHSAVASVVMLADTNSTVHEPGAASVFHGSVALESVMVGEKDAENQVETNEQKGDLDFDLPMEMMEIHSIASPHIVDDTQASDPMFDGSHFTVVSGTLLADEHNNVDDSAAASALLGSVALESAMVEERDAENQIETNEQKRGLDSDLPKEMVGIHSIASTRMVDDTQASDPTYDDSHFTIATGVVLADEHNNVDEPAVASVLLGSVPLESATVGEKDAENQIETNEQKKGLDIDLPTEMVGIHSIASPHMVDDTQAIEHDYNDMLQKPFEYNIFLETPRKELHTFYGPAFSVVESPSVTSLKAVSPVVSSATERFSSHHNVLGIMDVQVSGQSSNETAGEEKMPVGHGKGALSHKKTEVRRQRRFPVGDDKHVVYQTDKSTPQFTIPNGELAHSNGHPPKTLDTYNGLLREGRLKECIRLLEDWEQKDLLDMDKIHHASFFKTCKKQKAVKEAFCFIKLIPNPTLSTFNMLMAVCASSQDIKGAREVLQLVQESGMVADCKLYTTLISTCAKSGKVDAMFEVFHQMANSEVEPNLHTFGALIDGCARAGQVAKAFGAYGILRSKDVKPDRVVFNALISACGQSGAVDRAFDVLAEMRAEAHPIDPDHITIGALMKACFKAGQVERAKEVYKMIYEYGIRGTPEVYTIAVNSCSKSGDWEFACNIYNDMKEKGVTPDEVFFSALIDVAGHAGMLDNAFDVLQDAKSQGIRVGSISYSSLMGACCNAKNWQKALELYEKIKSIKLRPTVSTMNALITALCEGNQLPKALEILEEIKALGLTPNEITYSMLMLASERKDDSEVSFTLLSQAKEDGVSPNLIMCRCITSMCMRRFEKACATGEPVLSFKSGRPQIENKWTSTALTVYRETILGGIVPTTEVVSQVLGCLRLPRDASLRDRLIENLGVSTSSQRRHNLFSLVDGFGEYDPRAFSLLEEATSLGILPSVSFNKVPILFDSTELPKSVAEVYLLTILKGLKHRLAAGAKLPHVNVVISTDEKQVMTPEGERTINLIGRVGQEIVATLRRLGIPCYRKDLSGKIRINGVSLKKWFQPKLDSPFTGKPEDLKLSQVRLGNQIFDQQRRIRAGNLSLDNSLIRSQQKVKQSVSFLALCPHKSSSVQST